MSGQCFAWGPSPLAFYYSGGTGSGKSESDNIEKQWDYSYSYHGACTQTCMNENQGGELGNSLGVVFSSGFGARSGGIYLFARKFASTTK